VLQTIEHRDLGTCLETGIQQINLEHDPRFLSIRKGNGNFYFDQMSTNVALPVSLPAGFHFQIKLLTDNSDALYQILQRYIEENDLRLHDLQINAHTFFRLDHHINLKVSKVNVISMTSSLPRLEENLWKLDTFFEDRSFDGLRKYIRLQLAGTSPCMHIVTQHQGGHKRVEALCPRNFDIRQADRIRKRLSQYLYKEVRAA
jgi:hypothetical protein